MASVANFEQVMADEIDLLTGRVASLSTAVPLKPVGYDSAVNMPCMYTPHPHLPLTPPEYLQQYNGCGMRINQHQYAVGAQGLPLPEKGVYEINVDSYGRKLLPSFVPAPQGYHHAQQQATYNGHPPPGITHPGGQYYIPSVLQPQRRADVVDEFAQLSRQEARRPEQPAAAAAPAAAAVVEEKPTGGVSAHLDYDMDEMTEFVGTMAQRLVAGQQAQERMLPSYRKFVYQILSSTRLPSSTILLGLVYLRERVAMPKMAAQLRQEHVYRLLTISLLLASKFLDDNTFQNKSWSEVTHIPVQELNLLEKEWLRDIKWNLHIDPEGTKGFSQYKAMWESWVKKNATTTVVPPLAPIETNLRARSHSTFSPVPLYPPAHQHYTPPHSGILSDKIVQLPPVRPTSQVDSGYWSYRADYSPPSAPQTGPTTPEGHFGWSFPNASQAVPQQTGYSRLPPIVGYNPHGWHGHHPHSTCSCYHCRQQNSEGYFMAAGYGQPITA
jgi:hypothetical protein